MARARRVPHPGLALLFELDPLPDEAVSGCLRAALMPSKGSRPCGIRDEGRESIVHLDNPFPAGRYALFREAQVPSGR